RFPHGPRHRAREPRGRRSPHARGEPAGDGRPRRRRGGARMALAHARADADRGAFGLSPAVRPVFAVLAATLAAATLASAADPLGPCGPIDSQYEAVELPVARLQRLGM